MAEVPPVFDQPGAGFVTLPAGIKFPPPYKEWQKPENARTFAQGQAHKGNVGVLAGNGFVGLDKDNPAAFDGLSLPTTTTWETRPGRLGMWFKVSDNVAEALQVIGKKTDLAQLKLYKDGKPCGEVKLQRTYQIIPPSWKKLEDGTRADYKLLDSSPPGTISLSKLLADLQAIGITFSSKLEANAKKLEDMGKKDRQRRIESDESKRRRYAEAALRSEVLILASTPVGDRNPQLFKSAANMGELEAAGVLTEAEVILALSEAAENTGLESEEIRKTIISGLNTGKQHPREIPEKPKETEEERRHREHAEANPPLTRERADQIEAATGVHVFNAEGEISEEELKEIPRAENPALEINLEPDNLISRYMKYGATTCDAYPEYHYTSALSLLSICTNRNLRLSLSQDYLYPNIWAMNLGKTTVSRKSAAIGKFERFAEDLFPAGALPQSYSPEGLLEELTEKSRGYLVKDEAAAMIEAMEKNYMLEMRDIYCILYDCKGYRRKIRSSQRNKQSEYGAKDPFINILCATTPEAFSKHTSILDLTSGWLLRFLYTFPTYKKPYMHFKPMSEEDQSAYAEVLSRLAHLKGLLYAREDVIEIELDPEAWAYYQAWQEQRENELVDVGDDIQLAFFGRLAFTALKLAILFTVGRADYTEETNVSLAHVQEACRQADSYFIPIGRIIADFIAMDETNNLQEKVLATLGRNSGRLKWTKLMQKTHADKDKLEKAVSALVESEEVADRSVSSEGHKPARWILLNNINKTRSASLKPIRYVETKDNKDSNDSKNSKDTKDSTYSEGVPGIPAIFAKKAIFASFAIHGSDGEDAPPASGPHPRKESDPDKERFKAGLAAHRMRHDKHTCRLCEEHFEDPLTVAYHGGGFICERCRRDGAPSEPIKADPQIKLAT